MMTKQKDNIIYSFIKRSFDLLAGITGSVFLLPASLMIKIAYLISGDRAGIFYKQQRVGYKGKRFNIYKFRSMGSDADKQLEEMLQNENYRQEWEEKQKISDDPRVTAVGKLLRKSCLDEMPQFINLIKGDMSFVGPRPLVPGELEAHGGSSIYNDVRPGLTGCWTSTGRASKDYDERLEMEYYYVKNRSLKLDAEIILRTALLILRGGKPDFRHANEYKNNNDNE